MPIDFVHSILFAFRPLSTKLITTISLSFTSPIRHTLSIYLTYLRLSLSPSTLCRCFTRSRIQRRDTDVDPISLASRPIDIASVARLIEFQTSCPRVGSKRVNRDKGLATDCKFGLWRSRSEMDLWRGEMDKYR